MENTWSATRSSGLSCRWPVSVLKRNAIKSILTLADFGGSFRITLILLICRIKINWDHLNPSAKSSWLTWTQVQNWSGSPESRFKIELTHLNPGAKSIWLTWIQVQNRAGLPESRCMYGIGWTKETTFHQLWHLVIRKSFYLEDFKIDLSYLETFKISLDFTCEGSKYAFTFLLDHSASEGTGFLWTIFHKNPFTVHMQKKLQNKFLSLSIRIWWAV